MRVVGSVRHQRDQPEVAGPRGSDASASVGTYLVLAALNRLADPGSKRAFAE